MNLNLSLLGWVHTLACLVALALGTTNLVQRKGTRLHRRIGHWYLATILLVCVTSLGIYRLHRFFFPHWLAIATIVLVALAYGFAHFQRPRRFWLRGHIISIVLSVYMLIGGGVNEVFLRVDVLRRLAGGFPSPVIGGTHYVVTALTLLVLIWFNVKYSGNRRRRVAAHGHPAEDGA
ncbi:MAG: hypothetical protein ABSC95_08920 [Acetobacteraceae bacterium]